MISGLGKMIINKKIVTKQYKQYNNSKSKLFGERLFNIRKAIGEDVIFNIITNNDEYIISNIETLRSIKLKQKLQYDGSEDYDNSNPDPKEWGVL